jgi:glutathione S-transferase
MNKLLDPLLGHGSLDSKKFAEGLKTIKELAKILDTHLKGKDWLVGK